MRGQCEQQLERGLSSLLYPGEDALFRELETLDEEVVASSPNRTCVPVRTCSRT